MKEIPAFIDSKGCDFTISCSDMTYVDHVRAVAPYFTPNTIFLPFAIREAHLGRLSAQCLVLSREPRRLRAHLFDVKTTSGTSYVTQNDVGDAPGSPYRRPVGHKGLREHFFTSRASTSSPRRGEHFLRARLPDTDFARQCVEHCCPQS